MKRGRGSWPVVLVSLGLGLGALGADEPRPLPKIILEGLVAPEKGAEILPTALRQDPGSAKPQAPAASQPAAKQPASPAPATTQPLLKNPVPANSTAAAPVMPIIEQPCDDGPCPLYYRDKLTGGKKNKNQTAINNRAGEPNWYKYYRCQHYGYYPTRWNPWPDGWYQCRIPQGPAPHPNDVRPPAPATEAMKKDAQRQRDLLRRGGLEDPSTLPNVPPSARPGDLNLPNKQAGAPMN